MSRDPDEAERDRHGDHGLDVARQQLGGEDGGEQEQWRDPRQHEHERERVPAGAERGEEPVQRDRAHPLISWGIER